MAESRESVYEGIRPFAKRTFLQHADALDERFGATILYKPENQQQSKAFKQRGAGYKMQRLHDQGAKRVVTFSAGNHAQGVALAAEMLDMDALVIVPETAPQPKLDALEATRERMRQRGRGVLEIVRFGLSFPEAAEYGLKIASTGEREAVHPFDDRDVVTGQGSIGHELIDDDPDLDAILVQVGGAGLVAGVSESVKARSPRTQVIAVEPEGTPTLHTALQVGQPVDLATVDAFADGLAVKRVGETPFAIAAEHLDGSMLVTNSEIKAGMRTAHHLLGARLEPAGAVGIGALAKAIDLFGLRGKRIAVLHTGGNVSDQVFAESTRQ